MYISLTLFYITILNKVLLLSTKDYIENQDKFFRDDENKIVFIKLRISFSLEGYQATDVSILLNLP